jgi:hypothetical protein
LEQAEVRIFADLSNRNAAVSGDVRIEMAPSLYRCADHTTSRSASFNKKGLHMTKNHLFRPLLLASLLLALSAASFAGVFVSVSVAPPPIPIYSQPMCPGPGFIFTPGYWGWSDEGYYWVPGTWVMAPQPGYLWTPGYWGWNGGVYAFNGGYWGPHVGWYGGINYGFGYGGRGYQGGEWRGNNFYYNRSVNNVNITNIRNVYNKTVIVNNNSHVSYNGGTGGVRMQPNAHERQWQNEKHMEPTRDQLQQHQEAAKNPQLFAKNNGGKPAIAATARPADFKSAVPAKAAGGRVSPTTLNANAKNLPATKENNSAEPKGHGEANSPKPSSMKSETHGNSTASPTAHKVPKPPNAENNTHGSTPTPHDTTAPSASKHNVPKPPPTATSPSHENSSKNAAPVNNPTAHTSTGPAPHQSQPQHSASQPRQHAATPQQHSAPQQQHSATTKASMPPQHGSKPSADHENKPPK